MASFVLGPICLSVFLPCQQVVRQVSKLLLKGREGPVDSELQPHWMLGTTSEPQNRKISTLHSDQSCVPAASRGFCSADVLLPPVEVSLSLGKEPMWPAS